MVQSVVVGGGEVCGPNDNPCNGELEPSASYGVRYRLFSGEDATDFPFSDTTFTTCMYTCVHDMCVHVRTCACACAYACMLHIRQMPKPSSLLLGHTLLGHIVLGHPIRTHLIWTHLAY